MESNDFPQTSLGCLKRSFDFVQNNFISQRSSDFLRIVWNHKRKARISIDNPMKKVVAFL